VTLDVDGAEQHVAWDDLGRGKVQVEFSRPGDACEASDDVGEV